MLSIQHTYSCESFFSFVKELWIFLFDTVWRCAVIFLLLSSTSSYIMVEINSQFKKQEKRRMELNLVSMESVRLVLSNVSGKTPRNWSDVRHHHYIIKVDHHCKCLHLSIYISIYLNSHSQTDCFVLSQFFNVARHAGCFKLGSKPAQLYVRLSILPLSHRMTYVSSGIITHYIYAFVLFTFCVTGYRSTQFVRRDLHYAGGSH